MALSLDSTDASQLWGKVSIVLLKNRAVTILVTCLTARFHVNDKSTIDFIADHDADSAMFSPSIAVGR